MNKDNFENTNDNNIYDIYNYDQLNNLEIDNFGGNISDSMDNKSNNRNSDINQEYLFSNEDIIPYSPEMSEEPEHPNKTKKIITENILNNKKEQNDEEAFTFKNNIKKTDNFNFNDNKEVIQQLNDYHTINDEQMKKENNNQIEANILNFEDVINKRNNEIMNKSKIRTIDENNNKIKNDKSILNTKINPNKKNSKIQKNKEKGTIIRAKKLNNIKKENKSQKKSNNKLKIFEQKTFDAVEFENFMEEKKIDKSFVENKNKRSNKNNGNKINKEKINDLFKRNTPNKKTEIISKIKKDKINNYQRKSNIKLRNPNIFNNSKDISSDNAYNFKNIKKEKINKSKGKTNKSFILDKENLKLSSKSQILKRKRPNTLRDKKKVEDTPVPLEVTEAEINLALKNKKIGRNIQERFSPINNKIINFDNSKFVKYDTEQMRYGLIKDYSNIHPEKEEGFLQRMQFDSLKRKNKDIKMNELLENKKKKYKVKEAQREKAFDRLMDDANRRLIIKQEMLENEKYLMDYKDLMNNGKKYNKEEWNKIYNKRFKDYEEYKKKKIDIQIQNEKIKKMIKEEEEINMCQMKKIPESRIRENTQRLFDDAKKREFIKNKNINAANSVKNYKIFHKNNVCLTSFNDEEDASKYMKGYKSEVYSFMGDKENINKNNNHNENFNNLSFDYKLLKKNKKMTVTEFNNRRFDMKNNKPKIRKNKTKYIFDDYKTQMNDFTFKNNNIDISSYFDFKRNKAQKTLPLMQNNNFSSPLNYGYNYNNYNIYNINNLNNNINSINNNNENDIETYNLNNIAEQILHKAAINKIESYNNKMNFNNYHQNVGMQKEKDFYNQNYFNNYDKYNGNNIIKEQFIENNNKNFDYNPSYESNQLVEQFLSNNNRLEY